MTDFTFKPAGATIAAIVASLAPVASAEAAQPAQVDAAEELASAVAKFPPAVPFESNVVAFKRQVDLFE